MLKFKVSTMNLKYFQGLMRNTNTLIKRFLEEGLDDIDLLMDSIKSYLSVNGIYISGEDACSLINKYLDNELDRVTTDVLLAELILETGGLR